jgi:DNA-binding response OmpR family regulator
LREIKVQSELVGKRVLVVDDDIGFGKRLVNALKAAGAMAFGPALTTFQAECLLGRRRVDLALLDTSLYGKKSDDFAVDLRARAIPVMFMTEPGAPAPAEALVQLPMIEKPVTLEAALATIEGYLSENRGHESLHVVNTPVRPRVEQSPLHRLARCIAVNLERNAAQ